MQYAYEMSVREVMPRLDVELVDLENASCCGTPVQSVNMYAATYLAARNLAIAEKMGFTDLLAVCNGCHLSLFEALHLLNHDEKLKEKIMEFKTYMCLICGWVYDEEVGLPDEGIAPGTLWKDVPMNWTCPECGARKEDFEMTVI